MHAFKKFLPFLSFALFLVTILFPTTTKADIATVRDWIGLFTTTAGDGKSNTVGTTDPAYPDDHLWFYTSSTNCNQTPGTTPKLNRSSLSGANQACEFSSASLPTTGTYEYRLYANDGNSPEDLIARSKSINTQSSSGGGGTSGSCPSQNLKPRVINGLITTPSGADNFGNDLSQCIIDTKAVFSNNQIPNYDRLKSIYYDQSKTTKNTALTSISSSTTFSGDTLHYVSSDLTVSGNPTGTGTQVIFVDGNLSLTADYCYGTACSDPNPDKSVGTVFVVKNNVYIDPAVERIDAIIIAEGIIYTAGNGCSLADPGTNPQLVIYGSLISLTEGNPIHFCRKLVDNTEPAEKIIQQFKYLVILSGAYSDTLQKWSEISN